MDIESLSLEGKLYGRRAAVQQLKDSYQKRQNELVLLLGEAGSGKSSLARTLRQTIQKDGGFFISCKYDEYQSNSTVAVGSSSPIALAFTELLHLVGEDETLLAAVQTAVQQEIAANGHQIIDMIPSLGPIIDSSASFNDENKQFRSGLVRSGQGGREGFELVFGKFVQAVSSITAAKHPIVLFMDDLQWSDSWSLSLLHILLRNKCDNWFVFGAVRDNEVCPNDNLSSMLRQIEDEDHMIVTQIKVGNLDEQGVKEAVIDLLQQPVNDCQSLISIVYQQTGGNPLFLRQYLQYLCEEGLLFVDGTTNRWSWNQEELEANQFNDVCSMLEAKMKRLEAPVQNLLKVAACVGSDFSMALVDAAECGDAALINEVLETGYLYKNGGCLRWQHDKMRQAALRLAVGNTSSDAFQLALGWKFYRNLSDPDFDKNLFVILGQFCPGARLLVDQEEKNLVAKLCLRAGERSALCSNFETAASCYAIGLDLLSTSSWRDEYELTLSLHNSAAEAEYCVGDLARMDSLIDSVLQNARVFDDKLRASTLQIYALGGRNRRAEAAHLGLEVLRNLGERFPSKGTKIFAVQGLARMMCVLRRKSTDFLLRLPLMRNPNKLATMRLLSVLLPSVLIADPNLAGLFVVRLMQITLQHGLCAPSSLAFSSFAFLMLRQGNIDEAFRFGQLALATVEKFQATEYLPRVFRAVYSGINSWKFSMRSCLERLAFAYEVAMETGDIESAMLNRNAYALNSIWAGRSLEDVLVETQQSIRLMQKYGQDMAYRFASLLLQFLLNLTGRSQDPLLITSDAIDQQPEVDPGQRSTNNLLQTAIAYYQFVLAFYLNEYDLAMKLVRPSHPKKTFDSGTLIFCLHSFYEAMTLMAIEQKSHKPRRIFRVRRILARLKKYEQRVPENCQNKVLLVEAELAAYSGNMDVALAKFTRSIDKAGEEGFVHEQALACERAGAALHRRSNVAGARPFLCRSQMLYREWGAHAKVAQMSQMYSLDVNEFADAPHQATILVRDVA